MQASELRSMGDEELLSKKEELRKTLFNLGVQKATGQLTNTSMIRQTRRDLARVLTVIKERSLKGNK
jgi:large subunit ribosomal protein L29